MNLQLTSPDWLFYISIFPFILWSLMWLSLPVTRGKAVEHILKIPSILFTIQAPPSFCLLQLFFPVKKKSTLQKMFDWYNSAWECLFFNLTHLTTLFNYFVQFLKLLSKCLITKKCTPFQKMAMAMVYRKNPEFQLWY